MKRHCVLWILFALLALAPIAFILDANGQDAPAWTQFSTDGGKTWHPRGWAPLPNIQRPANSQLQRKPTVPRPETETLTPEQQLEDDKKDISHLLGDSSENDERGLDDRRSALDSDRRDIADLLGNQKGLDNQEAALEADKKDLVELGRNDALVDNNSDDQRLFASKNAIDDALTAKAHGRAGIDQLAGLLVGSSFNPELHGALERAKAETNLRFDRPTADVGQFNTVVIEQSADSGPSPVWLRYDVPKSIKNDRRFQKLIIERNALQRQSQNIEAQISTIEADPSYHRDGKRLTKHDQLTTTDGSLKLMAACLNKIAGQVVEKEVTLDAVDFSETPPPRKGLDNSPVPVPRL